ncbi:MAG: carbohydrate-binding domain-containing protein [Lachnospiraceae bacterium]|nr:carbohydrate-binding domain-containing protein [Lachnospiraceae bacterium]
MRNTKKTAAKVFTFLLCLTLLAGCTDSNGNSSQNGNGNDTQVTATADPGNSNTDNDKNNNNTNTDPTGTVEVSTTPDNGNGDNNTDNQTGNNSENSEFSVPASATFKTVSIEYKNKDLATSYVPGDCTSIVFSEDDVKVVGKETEISYANGRKTVTIVKKGDYLISGSCSNGQIIVEAENEKDVRLILNGVNLTCTDSAPIYEKQCDKMVITLADGSENFLSDTSEYVYDNVEKKHPDAVIFAKDDLVINGNGSLTVNSTYSEGIHSTDSVKLISGNITVKSADNGVRGKEGVIIKEANLDITSKGDGIKTTYSDNTSLGYIIIEGGKIKVYSAKDGIQATGHIQITGGNIDITTDNGVAHADSDEESKSAKGIKSDNNIYIKGAGLKIESVEDGIKAGGNIIFDGDSVSISTIDDAVKADGDIVVNSGNVSVGNAKKGLKGKSVTVNGGSVALITESDGIKASNSKDDDADSKVIFGEDDPFAVSEDVYVAVTGGDLSIATDGDFIDSNGNLYITGGSIVLNGTKAAEDGGVSYKGVAHISGGNIEANGVGDIKDKILNKTE